MEYPSTDPKQKTRMSKRKKLTNTRRTRGLTGRTEYKALAMGVSKSNNLKNACKKCKMLEIQTQMANPKPKSLTNKVEKENEHLREGHLAHKQDNQPHKEPKTTSTNSEKNHQTKRTGGATQNTNDQIHYEAATNQHKSADQRNKGKKQGEETMPQS